MITKLVAYHANPTCHAGYEYNNIAVANELCNTTNIKTFDEYIALCIKHGAIMYSENVFDDHINKVPYH